MPFLNKVVLVTGAASGIGEAAAVRFAKGSARLALVDIRGDLLKKSVENCEKISRTKVLSITADLTKEDDVKRVVETTVKQYGRIDVLVNCAGIEAVASIFDDNILETYDRVIGVNLRAVVALTNAAIPALIESKGNVVNVSGESAKKILTSFPDPVSKAGLNHFTRCAALDLSPHGIRVNAVMPGTVETNLYANAGFPKATQDAILKKAGDSPLKRKVKGEDVAELITFLASDAARSITGSTFSVDSGSLLQ